MHGRRLPRRACRDRFCDHTKLDDRFFFKCVHVYPLALLLMMIARRLSLRLSRQMYWYFSALSLGSRSAPYRMRHRLLLWRKTAQYICMYPQMIGDRFSPKAPVTRQTARVSGALQRNIFYPGACRLKLCSLLFTIS